MKDTGQFIISILAGLVLFGGFVVHPPTAVEVAESQIAVPI